jgi:hypothetical protein
MSVTIVKKEWHQVSSEFSFVITLDVLKQIYPANNEEEMSQLLKELEEGFADIENIVTNAMDNDFEIEWNHVYDDWWTQRKGGYEITYELEE